MSKTADLVYNNSIGGATMPKTFTVIIHPCTDVKGYWAECKMPNGGCTTQGNTLQEIQSNMFESIELYLEDYPEIINYLLVFELCEIEELPEAETTEHLKILEDMNNGNFVSLNDLDI